MIIDPRAEQRLKQHALTAQRELQLLRQTDARLFVQPFTPERAQCLDWDQDLAERVEAFAARYARLQDLLGDKMLSCYLLSKGEPAATFADNLERAARLGLIEDAQQWIDMRKLRNFMVHEYVNDPVLLASALEAAHRFVPVLAAVTQRLAAAAPEASAPRQPGQAQP